MKSRAWIHRCIRSLLLITNYKISEEEGEKWKSSQTQIMTLSHYEMEKVV